MDEKTVTPEIVETAPAAEEKKAGSFKCIAEPMDKRIFGISLLTAIIVVVAYHFVMLAVNSFCEEEPQFVSCYCHQSSSGEEDNEDKPKEFRRKRMNGEKGKFFRRPMSPEMREKIKNMSPEERKAFFAKLREKRGEKAPRRLRGPRQKKDAQE